MEFRQETNTAKAKSPSWADLKVFFKLRLSSLVVFSAALSYVTAKGAFDWTGILILSLGGFLVTGASNGINQIIEKHQDSLMKRTENRPVPAGRMSVLQGYLIAIICGILGLVVLWFGLNPLSGILGLLSLILYTLTYTPLKARTPFAVFVGAFPGAVPPLLGWVAGNGHFGLEGWILFGIQFLWQFPHFWALGWVLHDDYRLAGYHLLPSPGGRDRSTAFQVMIYTLMLILCSLLPLVFGFCSLLSAMLIFLTGMFFFWQARNLYKELSIDAARKLMFGSFVYLPVVQLVLMIDRILTV